jgi:hypothetical protein
MRRIVILAASALTLTLAACGDSGKSDSNAAPAPAASMTTADCKDPGSAMGYIDARQKAIIADVKANKPGIGEKFNEFLKTNTAEANKAQASNDWVGYCKAVDAALTAAGY